MVEIFSVEMLFIPDYFVFTLQEEKRNRKITIINVYAPHSGITKKDIKQTHFIDISALARIRAIHYDEKKSIELFSSSLIEMTCLGK